MAKLSKNGVTIQIKDIISYYCEGDDINDLNDKGTYESFSFIFKIKDKEIFDGIMGNDFELCEGNICSLIQMIEDVLISREYQEIEFLEPNFLFECVPDKELNTYLLSCWVNSGCWESFYSDTNVGCRFYLKEEELRTFLKELIREWEQRKKQKY